MGACSRAAVKLGQPDPESNLSLEEKSSAPQQTQARANIGAQSAAAIGDPDRDLVADYTAAKA